MWFLKAGYSNYVFYEHIDIRSNVNIDHNTITD